MFNVVLVSLVLLQTSPPQLYDLSFDRVESDKVLNAGFIELTITPQSGYKWGTEYNAKLKLENNPNLILKKTHFSSKNKDFLSKGKGAVVKIPFKIKSMKDEIIRGKLNFLVCNKKHCVPQRNVKVKFKLVSIPGC
tara:strand:- start:81 stop:488 length:408 start_codon:yes stop_codon:yes gene_type:complete